MLDVALQFLKDEVSSYLLAQTSSSSVSVKLSKVVNEHGRYAFDEESICSTIINIEEERTFKSQVPEYAYVDGRHVVLEPDLKLVLSVLFAANFRQYDQALKFLSYIMTFFQSHSVFSSEQYPALDPRIGRLTVELQSLNFEQLNQMWAFIGGKQLPSVVYKVRLILLQDESPTTVQLPITILNANLQNR